MARKTDKELKAPKDELDDILDKIEKDFGKGTVIGAKEKPTAYEVIPTGSIGLDKALGVGGLPRGRIIEIFGPESSGKTTLAIHIIAEAQKKYPGLKCAIVDAEHALDVDYAEDIGVDLNNLLVSQPDNGEQALEVTDRLAASGRISVIVVDSVAALTPKSEIDGEMGDSSMGKQARLMSQALRKLTATVNNHDVLLIFINQLREKIGVMFGNPETTTGGNALKFYASVRLDIRKILINKDGEDSVSNTVRVKVIKNKVAPPFKKAEFRIKYGEGIEKFREIITIAVDLDIINKSGSWYSYLENKIGQGEEQVVKMLRDNTELYEEIKNKVLDSYKNLAAPELDHDEIVKIEQAEGHEVESTIIE